MSRLTAHHLRVAYGELVAVDDLSLVLEPGTFLAVTGPSGAGKTSLIWALAGATPISGEVTFGATRITGRQVAANAGIGVVPQGNGLVRSLPVTANVVTPLVAAGMAPRQARAAAAEALEAVGMDDSATHLVDQLSGGQQQRVAIARALAGAPRVLLADEPTSDLDGTNRGRVIDLLRAASSRGAVVVMTTHDPDAAAAADCELALDEGRAAWTRPPA